MNTRRATTRREEEGVATDRIHTHVDQVTIVGQDNVNEAVPPLKPLLPQGHQIYPMPKAPQVPFVEGEMTNAELRTALMNFTQLMKTQAQVVTNDLVDLGNQGDRPQPNVRTPTCRIRDLVSMNPPTLHGPKVDEDPKSFIDELAAYKLEDVSQMWFE
ncbi:hypothetical protein EJD97_006607 [Solanum chilense]|uniref:Gag-pol polyprotein n=1 Tax=Solanum chilense TaxID=4083 RepID=A0A6N2CCR4_SOLCI|nr:hypothetical protein EJD97_006607 [Solanum chilense]